MRRFTKRNVKKAQTAIEYLLLLSIVAIVVFTGFRTVLSRSQKASGDYFNKAREGIVGPPPNAFVPLP